MDLELVSLAVPICSCYAKDSTKYQIGSRHLCFSCVLLLLTDPRLNDPKQSPGKCTFCQCEDQVISLKFRKRICETCLRQAKEVRLAAGKDVLSSQLAVFRNRPVSEIVTIRHQALTYLLAHSHLKQYEELSQLGKEMLAAKPKDDYLRTIVYERLVEASEALGDARAAKFYGYKHQVMLERIARSRQKEFAESDNLKIDFGVESVFVFYGGRTTFTSYVDRRTLLPSMFPASLYVDGEVHGSYCFWVETSLSHSRPLKAELELTDVLFSTEGISAGTANDLGNHECRVIYPTARKLECS